MAQTTLDQRMLGVGTALTDHTITASDVITFADVGDSNLTKKDTVQGVLDLAGGGQWTHVSTTDLTGASAWQVKNLSADEWYKVILMGVVHQTDNTSPEMTIGHGAGDSPTMITGSGYRYSHKAQSGSTDEDDGGTGQAKWWPYGVKGAQSENYTANVEIVVYTGSGDSVRIPTFYSWGQHWQQGDSTPTTFTHAGGNVDSAFNSAHCSSIKIEPSADNFDYGEAQFFNLSN